VEVSGKEVHCNKIIIITVVITIIVIITIIIDSAGPLLRARTESVDPSGRPMSLLLILGKLYYMSHEGRPCHGSGG
jgi:hypothetical protein